MLKADIQKKLSGQQGEMNLQISFELPNLQFLSLYGESGVGKTTILRCLSGLCSPDKGIIEYNGKILFDSQKKINIKPQQRNIGFMFQNYSLFPNMTIRQNLFYAAKKNYGNNSKEKEDLINEFLQMSNLTQLADQKPSRLSGGQKQRVAFFNTLISGSKLLFFDEPFSALDLDMHKHLQNELKKFVERFQLTAILVSHNLSDIFKLSNRVIEIKKGKIFNDGSPSQVFLTDNHYKKFNAEIIAIETEAESCVITLLAGNAPVKISIVKQEAENYSVGDQVQIDTKTFYSSILKKH